MTTSVVHCNLSTVKVNFYSICIGSLCCIKCNNKMIPSGWVSNIKSRLVISISTAIIVRNLKPSIASNKCTIVCMISTTKIIECSIIIIYFAHFKPTTKSPSSTIACCAWNSLQKSCSGKINSCTLKYLKSWCSKERFNSWHYILLFTMRSFFVVDQVVFYLQQ